MTGDGAGRSTGGHGDPRRDPGALALAITARWRRYRLRAYLFGFVVGIIGTIPVVIATAVLAIGLSVLGVVVPFPWDELIWTIAFLLLFAVSGAWAVARWLPRPFRAALESYVWLATRAEAHWAEVIDTTPVPRKPEAQRAFLDSVTVTPALAGEIATIWLALGDVDTARRVMAAMPGTSDLERHQKAETAWLIDFVEGTDRPLDALEASAAALADETDRLEAVVGVAVDAARVALVRGTDWIGPMAAVRSRLGSEPSNVLWRFAFEPALRTMLLYGGIGVAAYWVFTIIA
jgi:hypothetical protein